MSNSSMRTPLGKVRGLGSARSGTEHFWQQRVTAVALALLTVVFVGVLVSLVGKPYAAAIKTLGHPLVATLLLLFVGAGAVHMRLGLQIIIEDYVHHEGLKVLALLANTFVAVLVGVASAVAILKLVVVGG